MRNCVTRPRDLGPSAGSYGWFGAYSTAWYNDPAEDMTTILMVQQLFWPDAPRLRYGFLTAAYQAIDD